jgi:hypothetical protein
MLRWFHEVLVMAFRSEEAADAGYESARKYLVPREFEPDVRAKSAQALADIVEKIGPAVDSYPSWHPLVMQHDGHNPERYPSKECGYEGLDHTRYFAHGFITCPYGDGQDVIDSVERLSAHAHHAASITAERLDASFYNMNATPILVRCKWNELLEPGYLIRKKIAIPLMLEQEVPCWRWSTRSERWETMRPYLLGEPHGNRSSLFVSQDTALALKKIYLSLVETGMFGPLKMG